MEIPVYLFTGFLESGKTSFIQDTLQDQSFLGQEKTLLILCEEGTEEFDEVELASKKIDIITVEDKESLNLAFLNRCNEFYHPDRVMVEYNGMWKVEDFFEMDLPDDWVVVQTISTIDTTTFDMYMANMRAMMLEQHMYSDLVIFNRCAEDKPRSAYRRAIKAVNKKGQVVFENMQGFPYEQTDEDLPYDIHADTIELGDDDFGIWYLDAMDHPEKYANKKIHFKAISYRNDKMPENCLIPGRFAMTCCADDIQFIGYICQFSQAQKIPVKAWIDVEALIRVEYRKEYKSKGIVLYASKIGPAVKPEEELIYF